MADCHPDEWISGLWFIVSGVACVISGFLSLLAIGPVLRDT